MKNVAKQITLGLISLSANLASAARLEEYLPVVPPALQRTYAMDELRFTRGRELKVRLHDTRTGPTMEIVVPKSLREIPAKPLAYVLAEALVAKIAKQDKNNGNFAKVIGPRLVTAGAAYFRGADNGDVLAMSWWKLRMDQPGKVLPLQVGQPVLQVNSTGNVEKGSLPPHGTLSLRYLGENGERDLLFNSGSNNESAPLLHRLLPIGGLTNTLKIFPLWDWFEAQRTLAFIDLDIHAYRLTALQAQFLEALAKEARIAQWGAFNLIVNNCANGVSDMINAILPFDYSTTKDKDLTAINKSIGEVIKSVDKRFPKLYRVTVMGVQAGKGEKAEFLAEPRAKYVPANTPAFRDVVAKEEGILK